MRAYIAALDPEKDLGVLAQHGLGIRPRVRARAARADHAAPEGGRARPHALRHRQHHVPVRLRSCVQLACWRPDPQLGPTHKTDFGQSPLAVCCSDWPALQESPSSAAKVLLSCKDSASKMCASGLH